MLADGLVITSLVTLLSFFFSQSRVGVGGVLYSFADKVILFFVTNCPPHDQHACSLG